VSCSAFQRADQVDVEGVKIPSSNLADLSCRLIFNLNFLQLESFMLLLLYAVFGSVVTIQPGLFYNNGFQKLKRIRKFV